MYDPEFRAQLKLDQPRELISQTKGAQWFHYVLGFRLAGHRKGGT